MLEKWQKLIWVFSAIVGSVIIGHLWFWMASEIFVKNDLEANLLQIRYIKMSGWSSNWNPYISQPIWQDPLLGYLNPVWAVPVMFLPVQLGVKTAYFLSLVMCGWGVYFLSRSQKINWEASVILAMTLLISGYPTARIMAGQAEKVMTLAFMPWIVLLLLKRKNSILSGLFVAMTIWSGDAYAYWYSLVIAGALLRFDVLFWAFCFGLVRIIPIWQVTPGLYKPIEPFLGRQNLFSIFYHLFLPIKQFWGGLMNLVPTNFGWWEKFSFIGALPSLVFFQIFKLNKLNLMIWVFIILAMVGFPSEALKYFHVPSRVFGYLSLVVLIKAGTIVKNKFLWIANLVLVLSMTWYAYIYRQLPKINLEIDSVPKGSLIAFDQLGNPVHVLEAQERGIRMVATNYGVMYKDSDAYKWLEFRLTGKEYTGVKPDYIIYSKNEK